MCFLSRLFCCNRCNRNCVGSFNRNVRMRYVDAGGAESCRRQNNSHHNHNCCEEHHNHDCDCE